MTSPGLCSVIASDFSALMTASTCWSHSARSASLEPKWWMTSAALTPASAAIARNPDAEAVATEPGDRGVPDAGAGGEIAD